MQDKDNPTALGDIRAPYTLRVSVRVHGAEPITGLEAEKTITVGAVTVTVKQRWPHLVVIAGDFSSEGEAEAFLERIKSGLWNLAIEHNIAFNSRFERRSITRADNPDEAARNLAKSVGLPIEEHVKPLHGLSDEEGYTVYGSSENIRFFSFSGGTVYTSVGWQEAERTLIEGIEKYRVLDERQDASLATALDLYIASFYEISIRARFLTLIMCLEVLAPATARHAAVVRALSEFKQKVEQQLALVRDEEEREALEALLREIDFKKETSIRRRVRTLVREEAPIVKDAREKLATKVVKAYDLRSTVVHKGAVGPAELREAHAVTLEAVKLLLRARLGLAELPPDDPVPVSQ